MLRSYGVLCAGLLIAALFLWRVTPAEPRADLVYANPSGIHTLDPARMSWTQDFRIALNIWEGLTTRSPDATETIPGAAALPPRISGDGRTLTFAIRPDARWSNGDPVTAHDFVRGWRRAIEPGTATDYAFLLTDHIAGAREYVSWRQGAISQLTGRAQLREHARQMDERFARVGVQAADERTLAVRLIDPCPYFLDLTALPVFLPCHASVERLREGYDGLPITEEGLVVYDPQWTKPDYHRNDYPGLITNGPYRLDAWRFKRRARLAVNTFHRDAPGAACRTVEMRVFPSVGASMMAYESGAVDFLTSMAVPYDHEIARLARSGSRPDFRLCDVSATCFMNFNCARATFNGEANPFLDGRVRRAFALAVDKVRIVDNVLKRGDRVARSLVPPGMVSGYDPPIGLSYDPIAARRLLADAGHPDGAGLWPIELVYTVGDERVVQALGRMWTNELGVQIELRSQESKTFAEEKANHRLMVARGNWYADYNDPTTFLDGLMTSNGNNDSGYSNARYDDLLAAARVERDPAARMEMLRRAEAIVVEEDLPILPLFHYVEPIAIKPYVRGLRPNALLWFPFRFVTIDRWPA